jgi:hypothetical protein
MTAHPAGHSADFEDLARRFRADENKATLNAYRYDHQDT